LIIYQTAKKIFQIELYEMVVNSVDICIHQDYFISLCRKNCPNYNSKYSCPPFCPPFDTYLGNCPEISVICYQFDLEQYHPLPVYHRIRAANSIMKSLIDKELLDYRSQGFKVAGSGSCRACKPCGRKVNQPCKKPEKRIYSLEAMGVDVNSLVKTCFGFELQWYKKGEPNPEYTCVVGAICGKENNN
jgi:predicted metal-binding protein